MKTKLLLAALFAALHAVAFDTFPDLETSDRIDTESVTNVAFSVEQNATLDIRFDFNAAQYNNAELTFGCDADGDGALSVDEERLCVGWGRLYNEFKGGSYDPASLERETARLMADDDVQRKSGIYEYLLSGGEREKALSIRTFTDSQRRAAFEKQGGVCAKCGRTFAFEEMEGDHIIPWSKGGRTIPENLQMLCKLCNATKSDK